MRPRRPGVPSSAQQFVFDINHWPQDRALLIDRLRSFSIDQNWLPAITTEVELILEEWLTNISTHGKTADGREPHVSILIQGDEEEASLQITDDGTYFNPTTQAPPDISMPAMQRPIGGLGIFMINKLASRSEYRRENGQNIFKIWKNLREPVLVKPST